MPRRFQFSLRALLAAMLVVAIGAAVAHYRRQAEIARVATEVEYLKVREMRIRQRVNSGNYCGPFEILGEAEVKTAAATNKLKKLRGQ